MEEYIPQKTNTSAADSPYPEYIPQRIGPKPISIEEYQKRQVQREEQKRTVIEPVEIPITKKKRGGTKVRQRKRLAYLLAITREERQPTWDIANLIWEEIHTLRKQLNKKKE